MNKEKGISNALVVILVLVALTTILGLASYVLMQIVPQTSFRKSPFEITATPQPEEITPTPSSNLEMEINDIQVDSQESDLNELDTNASSL